MNFLKKLFSLDGAKSNNSSVLLYPFFSSFLTTLTTSIALVVQLILVVLISLNILQNSCFKEDFALKRLCEDNKHYCKKHNITGFPTMLVIENGKKVKDYDGERDKNGILTFLNNLQ